jgi:hypothetical protein
MRSPAETAVFLAQIAKRIGGLLDSIGANHDGLATAAPLDGVERLLIERYLDRRAARFPAATKNRCSPGAGLAAGPPAAPLCVGPDGDRISRGTLQYRVLRAFRRAGIDSDPRPRRTRTCAAPHAPVAPHRHAGNLRPAPSRIDKVEAQLLGHCDGTLVRRLALRLVEHRRLLTVEINELTAEITVRVRTLAPSLLAIVGCVL